MMKLWHLKEKRLFSFIITWVGELNEPKQLQQTEVIVKLIIQILCLYHKLTYTILIVVWLIINEEIFVIRETVWQKF